MLLEARDVLGGRIASFPGAGPDGSGTMATAERFDRFDVGPTWYWPDYQHQLHGLIRDLGLERFEQFETGEMMMERSLDQQPVRMRGYVSSPASVRLAGGMAALVDALSRQLDPTRNVTGQAVRRLRCSAFHVELDSENSAGHVTSWRVEHVLLALPPRLAEHCMTFEPALPQALAQQWRATATWMAPHAKYVALYDTPFWREQGLSGEARSARGPLGEIHDASMPGGRAALFGFFSVPAGVRRDESDEVLRAHCRAQLGRLFGPQASAPVADIIKDWSRDGYTSTDADLEAAVHHDAAPAATVSGPWRGRLTGIASEWSPRFPGYLAGAIDAADRGVRALTGLTPAPR